MFNEIVNGVTKSREVVLGNIKFLSCCKDIDAILLYLFFEKRSEVLVVTYQVNTTAKQVLKILGSLNIVEELGRHGDIDVHIATLMMVTTSN